MESRRNPRETIVFYPDANYRTKLNTIALLLLLPWTAPCVFAGGYALSGILLGAFLTVVAHALLLPVTLGLIELYYRSIRYEIRADEVVVSIGIITKTVKHVPFRTITNLKVARGPLDRILGIGSLDIQTAGASGTAATPEEKLAGLSDTQAIYEYIAGEIRRFRGALAPTQADQETPTAEDASTQNQLLLAILGELRAIHLTLDRAG